VTAACEAFGEFLAIELAVAVIVPAVELLEEPDHFAFDRSFGNDGAD
jgi:hypothetical protein